MLRKFRPCVGYANSQKTGARRKWSSPLHSGAGASTDNSAVLGESETYLLLFYRDGRNANKSANFAPYKKFTLSIFYKSKCATFAENLYFLLIVKI